ncbi:MAG: WGR domain-containing protein [Gammaproteobacteria bacterium]|nr:WGR domain-containing protein [Gammaproteobacteria bacterium]
MRIYLQTNPADTGPIRFIHLILQEDLMGGWSLSKESGYQGSSGKTSRHHFDSHENAMESMLQLRDKHIKRGYYVAFVQGQ